MLIEALQMHTPGPATEEGGGESTRLQNFSGGDL